MTKKTIQRHKGITTERVRGARGVQAVKEQGGRVLAEDEESCVVFGMPREAIATGKVDAVVPLPSMCREILKGCRIVG